MEKTLTASRNYQAPELHPVGTPAGAVARESGEARGDPGDRSGPRSRPPRPHLIGYAVIAVVVVLLGALVLATRSDLGQARSELTSLESELAATETAAADAAQSAAGASTAMQARISELMASVGTARDDLAATRDLLADAQDDATQLEGTVAELGLQLDDAEATVASTRDDVARLDALTGLDFAWWSWVTTPEDFEWFEAQGVDIAPMDEAVQSLGLAADWESWAGTNFFVAARVMGNYVDIIDDPAVTAAWDAWLGCTTMDGCGKAAVELDGALARATATTMASLRAASGTSRADM